MGRTRRQPPLYEVLSSPSRRLGGNAAAPRTPVVVPAEGPASVPPPPPIPPAPQPAAHTGYPPAAPSKGRDDSAHQHGQESSLNREYPSTRTAEREAPPPAAADPEPQLRISSMTVMIGLGAMIVVIAVVWAVAFQMGEKNRDRELGNLGGWKQPEGETGAAQPSGTPQANTPVPPASKPEGSGNAARSTPAPPPAAPQAGADPRVPGFNYLYLGSLTLKDANAAVDFMRRNGVQTFHVFDRQKPSGNNPPCRIYASQGFAGGALFRETQRERDELVRRVEELGKKWQREEKGPSDFRQPLWVLFKGS